MAASLRPCVFFDRDGIVNESPGAGYVVCWEEFRLLPGFIPVLRLVHERGYEAVIVTNQSGIAKGLLTEEAVEDIHQRLQDALASDCNVKLLDILYCPHDNVGCTCRKPAPGLLVEAAHRHGLDLQASWMIGDQPRDVEAGRRAGCRTVLVSPVPHGGSGADFVVADLEELYALLDRVLVDARHREA